MMDDPKKEILMGLIKKMHELIASGKYEEDEEMEEGEMEDSLEQAKIDADPTEEDMEMEADPFHDEVKNFMSKRNVGRRPEGMAVMIGIEKKDAKPMMKKSKKGKKKRA